MSELSYLKVFLDWTEATEKLSDADKGRLIDAMVRYARGDDNADSQLKGNEIYLFPMFRLQIDRDKEEISKKRQTNSENGKHGGAPVGNQNARKNKQEQAKTTENNRNKPDKDKDEDKDKDDSTPPYPPEGETGDATLFPDTDEPPQAEPSPPKAKRGTRQKDPPKSPELTPDEEAALLAYSTGLCEAVRDWFRYKAERRQMYGETFRRRFLGQVTKNASQYGVDAVTELIENCLSSGYQGVIWDKLPQMARNVSPQYGGNRANVADWDSIFAKLEGEIGHDATGNP